MNVDEILVWRVFLQLYQQNYDRFDYNVRLGLSADPGASFPDMHRKAAIALNSVRVDAVGWKGNEATIFEVRRRADSADVGQLCVYSTLWQEQQLSSSAPRLVMVTAQPVAHIVSTLPKCNIELVLVPGVVFSVLAPGRLIPPPAV
jgi:hypothetical protein